MKYFIIAISISFILSGFLAFVGYGLSQDIKVLQAQQNTIQLMESAEYVVKVISRNPGLKVKE